MDTDIIVKQIREYATELHNGNDDEKRAAQELVAIVDKLKNKRQAEQRHYAAPTRADQSAANGL